MQLILGGHFKCGHWRSLQNRPTTGLSAAPRGLRVEDVTKGVVVATELRARCEAASGTEVSEVVFEDAADEHHGGDVVAGCEELDGLLKHVVMDGAANTRGEGLELA